MNRRLEDLLWVGFHKDFGFVVFDPTRNPKRARRIQLWSNYYGLLPPQDPAVAKSRIVKLRDYMERYGGDFGMAAQLCREEVLRAYCAWRRGDGLQATEEGEFLLEELEVYGAEELQDGLDDDERIVRFQENDRESAQIYRDLTDDSDSWARQEEDGWFYED